LGGEPRGDWSPLGEIKVFIGGFLSKNERTALKERHKIKLNSMNKIKKPPAGTPTCVRYLDGWGPL